MKKNYQSVELIILSLDAQDVIRTSFNGDEIEFGQPQSAVAFGQGN